MAVQTLTIRAPSLQTSYSTPEVSGSRLTPPHPSGHRTLLPVGPAYLTHLRLALHHQFDFASLDSHLAEEHARAREVNGGSGDEDNLGVPDEEESAELLALDPKEWKKQDHYAVLGLSHFRYKATAAQIKIAHRKKVLKHHPDKKASSTPTTNNTLFLAGVHQNTNDDAFFKCIQKAHDVLTNAEKRRQFDSVDPQFLEMEEDMPTPAEFKNKNLDFFKTFTPIFELHSRFSKKQPVPSLGPIDASKAEVEEFYDFWYKFDSWRSFEWWDKEVNEGSDSRDDKRYTEKKNKSERARRKKEDIAKLRSLVDFSLSVDPRIKRIKLQEKEAREARKRGAAPGRAAAPTKEEEERKKHEERAMEMAEAIKEKEKAAAAKKEKEAAANAAKKARRALRAAEAQSAGL